MSSVEERFGPYGGRYVPETLIAALDELTAAWAEAREDADFNERLRLLHRDFIGRPTPLYLAERLSERADRRVYLKREDLAHTGAHKINNAIGQALLAQRMGKPRVIAETGAGQHGVATATACALFGLECVVYMGTEDIRRQRPNVERMGLLGAEVVPVDAGARTLKEAVSAAIRDWVDERRDDPLHHRLRGRAGALPGPRPRSAAGDRRRGARAGAGRRGRPAGAGDRLRRRRLQLDRHLHPLRRRRGGRADRGRGRRRGIGHGTPRRLASGRPHRRPARLALLGDRRRGGSDPRGPLDLRRARLSRRRPRARPPARHRPRQLRRGHRPAGAGGVQGAFPAGGDHSGAGVLARDRLAAGERRGGGLRRALPLRTRRQGPGRGSRRQ